MVNIFEMITSRINEFEKIKNLLKRPNKKLKFDRLFSSKGVQGIVGKIDVIDESKEKETNRDSNKIVFKLSNDINFIIEHETNIFKDISKLKSPHFVNYYSTPILSINKRFILSGGKSSILSGGKSSPSNKNRTETEDLFAGEEKVKRKGLFIEYLPSSDTFYNIVKKYKDIHHKKNLIISQVIQILISLEEAQKEISLSHYDLHMDNVIQLPCEENSYILYDLNSLTVGSNRISKDNCYLIPTYGYYPVIIDFGMSYSKTVNDNYLYNDVSNYNHGAQSIIFDSLNDIHHLFLSTFYYIEECNDSFHTIFNKLQDIFSFIPVLKKRGWKDLPNDFNKIAISKIKKIFNKSLKVATRPGGIRSRSGSDTSAPGKPGTRQSGSGTCLNKLNKMMDNLLYILGGMVKLPFKEYLDNEYDEKSFILFFDTVIRIYDFMTDKKTLDKDIFLSILKNVVRTINGSDIENFASNLISNLYENTKEISTLKELSFDKFSEDIVDYFRNKKVMLTDNIDEFQNLFLSGINISRYLSNLYYNLLLDHINIISNGYSLIKDIFSIESPKDFVRYFGNNFTPKVNLDNNSIIYIHKPMEDLKLFNCSSLTKEQLDKINISTFNERGKITKDIIKLI